MEKRRLIVLDDEPDFAAFVRMVADGLGFDVTVLTDPLLFKDSFVTVKPAIVKPGAAKPAEQKNDKP